MTKSTALSSVANPPLMIAVDGDVGGIGKSTLAVLVAMMFELVDLPLDVFELDEQAKLARSEVIAWRASTGRSWTPIPMASAT